MVTMSTAPACSVFTLFILVFKIGFSFQKRQETKLCLSLVWKKKGTNVTLLANRFLEFNSIEAVKQCVMAGLGLTILPAVTVAAELSQGRLLKLPWMGPDLTVVTHMVWHKDKWLSPALDAFLSLTREMLATAEGEEIRHEGQLGSQMGR
jgi:DNA-binding transcriptional LysR family regulator